MLLESSICHSLGNANSTSSTGRSNSKTTSELRAAGGGAGQRFASQARQLGPDSPTHGWLQHWLHTLHVCRCSGKTSGTIATLLQTGATALGTRSAGCTPGPAHSVLARMHCTHRCGWASDSSQQSGHVQPVDGRHTGGRAKKHSRSREEAAPHSLSAAVRRWADRLVAWPGVGAAPFSTLSQSSKSSL